MQASNEKEPILTEQKKLQIGYLKLRGRAQVPRLLLQYLKVPYEDILFESAKDWLNFKLLNQKKWPLINIPYLIDGDLHLTQTVPICFYIASKYGGEHLLLGKTPKDQGILEMSCLNMDEVGIQLISLCWNQGNIKDFQEKKRDYWMEHVQQKMEALEEFATSKTWMLGNLTIFDFFVYQLVHWIGAVFPRYISEFPRLRAVELKVRELQAIRSYQNSPKAIKRLLPTKPF